MITNINDYFAFVDGLASRRENEVFFNSGPVHAAIVMSRIFKHATHEVKIYCGGFNGAVSNDPEYLKYLQVFLSKRGSLKILAQQDLSKKGAKIFEVLENYSTVDIRLTGETVLHSDTQQPVHFAVGDDKMYRLEVGVEDYTAQVNFGDQQTATEFGRFFDDLFSRSTHKIALA